MAEMSKKEIRNFLIQGTLTGKLATVKHDESSHVVPIWFVLDDDDGNKNKSTADIVLPLTVQHSKQKTFYVIRG